MRQRREYVHPELDFTDLDCERRQQAFIASLAYQLKQGGTLTNPPRYRASSTSQSRTSPSTPAWTCSPAPSRRPTSPGGNVTFVTLPVDHFGKDPAGEDVNVVNVPPSRHRSTSSSGAARRPRRPPRPRHPAAPRG